MAEWRDRHGRGGINPFLIGSKEADMDTGISASTRIPSVDENLKTPQSLRAVERCGRARAGEAVRHETAILRREVGTGEAPAAVAIANDALLWREADARPIARAVFN